ncbi:GSCOCG00013572001-RA-CDS [Cotesia congregata]|nr:GSCOCG00013572001-RA-CDS [Cotesia congregata]
MKILSKLLSILIIIIPLTKAEALLGIHCKQNGDCTSQNSYCNETSNRCRCTDGYYPSEDKTKCVLYAKKVDDDCERDVGCKFVKHSWCDKHFCKCRSEEFQAITGECKPQSRGACNADGTCSNVLSDGVCNNDLYEFTSREEGCKNFPNSYKEFINRQKQCVCKKEYTPDKKNDMCLADIDMDCPDDSYCRVEHSFCNDWQKCECDYTYYPSADKKSCIKYEIGESCDQNKNCGPLQNSKCESKNCVCVEEATKGTDASSSYSCNTGFVQHNEFCYGVPGTVCSLTSKCLSSSYANLGTSCGLIKEHKEKYSTCSSKNGLTTCWMDDFNGQLTDFGVSIGGSRELICLVEHQDGTSVLGTVSASEFKCNVQWSTTKQSYESYKLLVDTRNLEWNKDYALDSAVLGGTEGTKLFLICRTEIKIGTYVLGRLEPPNYKSENFIFTGGICKCSSGFYSYLRNCYKIPLKPNVPVGSFEACRYLKNTVYSGGKCVCKIGYYLDDDHCSKIPTDLEVPCDHCPTDSSCSENLCHCNPGFVRMNGTCYGFSGSECFKESKCASKSHVCQSGICEEVEERKEDNKFCVGSVCWMSYDGKNKTTLGIVGGTDDTGSQFVCRSVHGTVTIPGELRANRWIRCLIVVGTESISNQKFDMLVKNEKLTWTNSFQLEQAVPGGTNEDNKPYLICRLEHDGLLYIGKLESPYNLCSTGGLTVLVSSKFEILVDSTVPGTCEPKCSAVDSVCSDGVCQCKPRFFKHNGTCYGLPQAECSGTSKCLSTAYSCESNQCKKIVEELTEGAQCVTKNYKLVCWKQYDGNKTDGVTIQDVGDAKENVCRVKYENHFLPGRQPEGLEQCLMLLDGNVEVFDEFDVLSPKDNLEWTKAYSLDKAVPAGDFEDKPLLFCRTEVCGWQRHYWNTCSPILRLVLHYL